MAIRFISSTLLSCIFALSTITVFSSGAITCSSQSYGRSCTLQTEPESIALVNNRILIGTADHLLSFPLSLEAIETDVDLAAAQAEVDECSQDPPNGLGNHPNECKNFIRVIQPVPNDDRIMVCGTNAFFPKCTLHNRTALSVYTKMTPEDDTDEGFSPHSNTSPISAVLASNGRFFSATHFQAYQPHKTIGMAPAGLQADSDFSVKAPTSDPLWLKQPDFVSVYEIGDFIYFFIKEAAYEVDMGNSVIYSRAIRICKNDEGVSSNRDAMFRTFQKARMTCSYSGSERGSIPYFYNNLQSTFLWESSDSNGQTTHILYAIFTSQVNGPEGSAVCKFSFDISTDGSLSKVFENGDYLIPVTSDNTDQILWERTVPGPFSCPGTSRDPSNHQLVASSVTPMDPEPLHVISGETLNEIAVDVTEYQGQTQEVMYFSTQDGEIRQVVRVEGDETAYEHTILSEGSNVRDLVLHKNGDKTLFLYATTDDRLLSISRGDCGRYASCFACFDSRDAYCGWSNGQCVNKFTTSSQNLIESFSANEEAIAQQCGSRPFVPTTPPPAPETTCGSSATQKPQESSETEKPTQIKPEENKDDCDKIISTPLGLDGSSPTVEKQFSIPILAGATVGAFVVGVPVGALVCIVFFKLFNIGPRRSGKGSEEVGDQSSMPNGGAGSLNQVNNLLSNSDHEHVQKKEMLMLESTTSSIPPRYVQVQPNVVPTQGPVVPMHKRSNSKDINEYHSPVEDDETFTSSERDHLPPLRSVTTSTPSLVNKSSHSGSDGVSRKKIPGYKVPRGRTDSTTWLRANSVSECSDLSSPGLESPISDV